MVVEDEKKTRYSTHKKDFVKKVAQHTQIKVDIVELILDGMVDVIIDEVIHKGKFRFDKIFEIRSKKFKGYMIRGSFSGDNYVPSTLRLTSKVLPTLKDLFRDREEIMSDSGMDITKESWRYLYKKYYTDPKTDRARKSRRKKSLKEREEFLRIEEAERRSKWLKDDFNPFIEEE